MKYKQNLKILGIWLVISPFILGFVSLSAVINNIALGVIILAFVYRKEISEYKKILKGHCRQD